MARILRVFWLLLSLGIGWRIQERETTAESHRKLFSGVLDLAVKCRECSRVVFRQCGGEEVYVPAINKCFNFQCNYALFRNVHRIGFRLPMQATITPCCC